MKKVLFLTTRLIYPVTDGRTVSLYNYCKGLAEQFDCNIRLFTILDIKNEKIKQPKFIDKVYCLKAPNRIVKAKNVIIKSFLTNKWPIQVSVYYSNKIKSKLMDVIEEYNPDIIICDMVRVAEYVRDIDENKYNKILDMDDILSMRYKRQYERETVNIDAIGAYSKVMPRFINKLIDNDIIIKYILKKEMNLMEKYENNISKYYKSVIFVSKIETEKFNKMLGEKKAIDITMGVDYEYFSKKMVKEKKCNYICFLGNMFVAHNKDAVENFINDIFPLILKDIPDAKLRIVGKCSNEYIDRFMEDVRIEVTGEVDDIRPYVQECTVLVAPLLYGSGIKTKILETMAMGVPVVTNSIGAEGIIARPEVDFFVENDNIKFANKVVRLIRDHSLNKYITDNAKLFVKENHRWKDIINKFSEIL